MVLETASRVSDEVKAEPLDDVEPASSAEAPEAPKPVTSRDAVTPELAALLKKAVPAAWLLAVIASGVLSGIELAFLVAAAGSLVLVIALLWSSVQSLTGSSALGFEEALGMGAPSKVEEEKRAVLRALKDLEYERGVGKITPEDYAELVAKYRAEAKRLMQSVDDRLGPAREQVEKQLAERLGRERRAGATSAPSAGPEKPDDDAEVAEPTSSPKTESADELPEAVAPSPEEKS